MSGPSKKDLERALDRMRSERDDARNDYAELVASKTRYAQSSGSLLFELGGSYPALDDLVAWLFKAHHAASALPTSTGASRVSSHHVSDPAGNRAVNPDNSRTADIDKRLGYLALWIADKMGDRGPLPDHLTEKPPVCNNPDCPAEGWPQPLGVSVRTVDGKPEVTDTERCGSCGDPFGAHRPRPRRFDQEELGGKPKPCWTRGCGMRGRIRQCEHSI